MTRTDYTEVDAAIVAQVAAGAQKFHKIWTTEVSLLVTEAAPGAETFRVVDRRLQALRKAKKLSWDSKDGWAIP